jgi:hypothetical protein
LVRRPRLDGEHGEVSGHMRSFSDPGHVSLTRSFTSGQDLPANRSIEFKFLLRDASGHAHWQHGANRTLRITTETPNTVVVHEDWDHGNKQKVSEEEELSIGEDVMFPEDLAGTDGASAIPADNPEKHQNVETDSDRSAAVVAHAPPQQEMVAANGTGQPQVTTTTASHLLFRVEACTLST